MHHASCRDRHLGRLGDAVETRNRDRSCDGVEATYDIDDVEPSDSRSDPCGRAHDSDISATGEPEGHPLSTDRDDRGLESENPRQEQRAARWDEDSPMPDGRRYLLHSRDWARNRPAEPLWPDEDPREKEEERERRERDEDDEQCVCPDVPVDVEVGIDRIADDVCRDVEFLRQREVCERGSGTGYGHGYEHPNRSACHVISRSSITIPTFISKSGRWIPCAARSDDRDPARPT